MPTSEEEIDTIGRRNLADGGAQQTSDLGLVECGGREDRRNYEDEA